VHLLLQATRHLVRPGLPSPDKHPKGNQPVRRFRLFVACLRLFPRPVSRSFFSVSAMAVFSRCRRFMVSIALPITCRWLATVDRSTWGTLYAGVARSESASAGWAA